MRRIKKYIVMTGTRALGQNNCFSKSSRTNEQVSNLHRQKAQNEEMSSANGSQTQKVLNLGSWKQATSRSEFTLNEQKLTSESSRRRSYLFPSAPCSFVFPSSLQEQEAVLLLGRGRAGERGRCTFMFRVYRRGKVQAGARARAYGGRLGALLRCSWSGQWMLPW